MSRIVEILETKEAVRFLQTRNLVNQYKKAKRFLLEGRLYQVRFKQRQPKVDGIFYFRINQQYRALGVFRNDGSFVVFKIDDHQN